MIVSIQNRFGDDPTTDPTSYCEAQYSDNPVKMAACLKLPSFIKPWTLIGKGMIDVEGFGSNSGTAAAAGPTNAGVIFGIPNMIFYVGAGLLGLGALLYAARTKKSKAQ